MFKTLVTTVAVMLAAPSAATTYDAFTSFNGSQNAGGFYYGSASGGSGTPFTNNGHCLIPGSVCLQSNANDVPGVYKSATAFHYLTVDVPNDRLLVHPGQSSDTYASFGVTANGRYRVKWNFNIVDTNPSGVALIGFEVRGGTLSGALIGFLNAGHSSASYDFTRVYNAGDFFGFSINRGGSGPTAYYNDSIGANFTVSQVPEPASWAMLIAGFGLTGAAMRRRRTVARTA